MKIYNEPETLEWEITSNDTGIKHSAFSLLVLILILLLYASFFHEAGLPDINELTSIGMLLFFSPAIIIIGGLFYGFLKNQLGNKKPIKLFSYRLDEKGITKRNVKNNTTEFRPWVDFKCFYKISAATIFYNVVSSFSGDEFMFLKKGSSYWRPQYFRVRTNINNAYLIEKISLKHLPMKYFSKVEPEKEIENVLIRRMGFFYYLLIASGLLLVVVLFFISLNKIKIIDETVITGIIVMFLIPVVFTIIRFLITKDKIKNNFFILFFAVLIAIYYFFFEEFINLIYKILSLFN